MDGIKSKRTHHTTWSFASCLCFPLTLVAHSLAPHDFRRVGNLATLRWAASDMETSSTSSNIVTGSWIEEGSAGASLLFESFIFAGATRPTFLLCVDGSGRCKKSVFTASYTAN
mmetsp:Transcript_8894/g.18441  ORF Transcript_8894/g.18441 Transcript_8894/m.18441 type:complete len:114 (+) Transcript_8894:169-510(+)